MLNGLVPLSSDGRVDPNAYDQAFVRSVEVEEAERPMPRSRTVERILVVGWVLIAFKWWLVTWAIAQYHIPIPPWVINVPTVIFGLICTLVYWFRVRSKR
jgi:hypothetical protein